MEITLWLISSISHQVIQRDSGDFLGVTPSEWELRAQLVHPKMPGECLALSTDWDWCRLIPKKILDTVCVVKTAEKHVKVLHLSQHCPSKANKSACGESAKKLLHNARVYDSPDGLFHIMLPTMLFSNATKGSLLCSWSLPFILHYVLTKLNHLLTLNSLMQ